MGGEYFTIRTRAICEDNMNRHETADYITDTFGVSGENLWVKFPEYLVFRNRKNKKWFALIADVEKSRLGLPGDGKTDIINLKCDPVFIGSLIHNKGYLPAYHMNKNTWITVLLDGSVDDSEIKDLICLSYEMIEKRK